MPLRDRPESEGFWEQHRPYLMLGRRMLLIFVPSPNTARKPLHYIDYLLFISFFWHVPVNTVPTFGAPPSPPPLSRPPRSEGLWEQHSKH